MISLHYAWVGTMQDIVDLQGYCRWSVAGAGEGASNSEDLVAESNQINPIQGKVGRCEDMTA